MPTRRKWLIAAAIFALALPVTLLVGVSMLRNRFEPYIREQTISYFQRRFSSDVTLTSLHISIPPMSPVHLLLTGGRGTLASVEGSGLIVRSPNTPGLPPVLTLKNFTFEVDLGAIFDSPATIRRVVLHGMTVTIPPKTMRAPLLKPAEGRADRAAGLVAEDVIAKDFQLVIMPTIAGKNPLTFDISTLHLKSVGKDRPMEFDAALTNPKPRGLVRSSGAFGPWNTQDPGGTPIRGSYSFDHADLSVFSAIAGDLNSTGNFTGSLSAINVKGEASVPDFRLKSAGNPVFLSTNFEVLVDGQNGNTILQPVSAKLGNTRFTTSGAVIRENGESRRTIALDAKMPAGNLSDVLRLAMKNTPLMEGRLTLNAKLEIPPLAGKVKEKLLLNGQFHISGGKFLRSGLQSKIDALSRRAQGQPRNEEITEVFSDMKGSFRMENQVITFQSLTFATAGARVQLAGAYSLADDALHFHGSLGLQARVSQTVTGWKRWALKPVDPFFAKNGVGTFLRIKIDGSSKSPNFGLDHGKTDPPNDEPVPATAPR